MFFYRIYPPMFEFITSCMIACGAPSCQNLLPVSCWCECSHPLEVKINPNIKTKLHIFQHHSSLGNASLLSPLEFIETTIHPRLMTKDVGGQCCDPVPLNTTLQLLSTTMDSVQNTVWIHKAQPYVMMYCLSGIIDDCFKLDGDEKKATRKQLATNIINKLQAEVVRSGEIGRE